MPTEEKDIAETNAKGNPFARVALIVSVVFHLGLVALLAVWYVNRPQKSIEEPVAHIADVEPSLPPKPNPPRPSPDVTTNQVNNTLDRMKENFENKPEEEQLSTLEEKAADLEKMATKESIDEIAVKFQEWANIQPRASEPAAEPVEGEFDFDSAQIHEVQRTKADDGSVKYLGVLVDRDGRTLEVEMNAKEGESAYRTLETLKKFPLANQVYRQIVMSLIDQAAASGSVNSGSAGDANTDVEDDDRDPFDGQLDKETSSEEPPVTEVPDAKAESETPRPE